MENSQLKEYIRRAKELEAAIYMQKELMSHHNQLLYDQMPCKPQLPHTPSHPYQPSEPKPHTSLAIIFLIFGVLICTYGCYHLIIGSSLALIICLVLGSAAILTAASWISSDKKAKASYIERYCRYQKAVEKYKEDIALADISYRESLQAYEVQSNEHKRFRANFEDKHNMALSSLTAALAEHYSLNIVFEKYRDIVAISAIDEYLSSGRCEKLEGPDGAYNLYEMELRQNIIIGQLSTIVDNLEKIKENQYTLYQELSKANATVDSILTELKDIRQDTQLTAHFSRITAIAATAPRYTYTLP